jgi:hypothetical protein
MDEGVALLNPARDISGFSPPKGAARRQMRRVLVVRRNRVERRERAASLGSKGIGCYAHTIAHRDLEVPISQHFLLREFASCPRASKG